MATLGQTRSDIAAALSTVSGVSVRTRPVTTPKAGDGWVVVTRLRPSRFAGCAATFTALVVLGADELQAETLLEQYAVPLLDAATETIPCGDVSLEAQTVVVGATAAPLYALALTMTIEVE
jgi:hypothetical protein